MFDAHAMDVAVAGHRAIVVVDDDVDLLSRISRALELAGEAAQLYRTDESLRK